MTATPLPTLTDDALRQAVALVGRDGITDDEREAAVLALVGDSMLARRVIDWLPEAFGLVLIPQLGNITLPTTFNARNRRGTWIEFAFTTEPLFEPARRHAFRSGPDRHTGRDLPSCADVVVAADLRISIAGTVATRLPTGRLDAR